MRLKGGGRGHRRSTPPSRQRRRSRPRPSSFLHSPRFRCPVMALFVVWSEQSEHSSRFALGATVSTFSVRRRGEGAKEPAGSRCPVRRLLLCRLPPEPRAGASALSAGAASVGQVAAPLRGPLLRASRPDRYGVRVGRGPSSVAASSVASNP